MKIRSLVSVFAAGLAVIGLSAAALAGSPSDTIIAKAPFNFDAGDQSFPAGSYRITIHRTGNAQELQLQNDDGAVPPVTLVPVTRLARQHVGDAPKSSLVFDTAGDKHFLSEVWFPGADGFLMRATKEDHTHVVVNTKN